jgi:hypothetical protein
MPKSPERCQEKQNEKRIASRFVLIPSRVATACQRRAEKRLTIKPQCAKIN